MGIFCGYTYQASSASQIYAAINTPTTHYYGSDGRWLDNNPDSWTRANYPTPSTSKSIFDPCPYGYRVPTSNADTKGNSDFFGFTAPPAWNPATNMINGQTWLGSWWPTSGRRYNNSAALNYVGGIGFNWSASPHPSYPYNAYDLNFYSGGVNPLDYYNRSNGLAVRCVQEKKIIGGYTYQGSAVSEIYTAINTPTIHYCSTSAMWHSSNPDSWTRANNPTPSTSKSIFDPCHRKSGN